MELTWYGLSCFRLTERGQSSVVADPFGSSLGLTTPKLKAEIVTVSHDAPGHNDTSAITGLKHVLTGPGEYEIDGIFVTGIATPRRKGSQKRNIIFVVDFNDITVAHVGDLATVPTQTQIDALGQVNILLLPVGGGNTLNAAQASEVVSMIEPNIVVPMHYAQAELNLELDDVQRFLKEMGVSDSDAESEPSLRIVSSNLPEETQVVVLAPKK